MTDNSTENQPTLDLAQRIAAALVRTDEPPSSGSPLERSEHNIDLGVVPIHLRHLYGLLDTATSSESRIIDAIFSASIPQHMAEVDQTLHSVKLLSDWTMVGVVDDGRPRREYIGGSIMVIQIGGQQRRGLTAEEHLAETKPAGDLPGRSSRY